MEPKYISAESAVTIERLYILPRKPTPQIQGIVSSDVVIVGQTVRGPVDTIVEITSPGRFLEVFGGRDYGAGGTLINQVWLALLGKKFGRVWVVRAAAAAATVATANLPDAVPTNIARLDASSAGAWANALISWQVSNASDGNSNHWKLTVTYLGKSYAYDNLDTTTGNDNTLKVLGDDVGNIVKLTKLANGRPVNGTGTIGSSSDGSIADSDFTGTNRALDVGFGKRKGVVCWMVAGRSSSTIKASLKTRAATVNGGFVLMCPDNSGISAATANTEALANQASGRIVYCRNYPSRVLDPEQGVYISVEPHAFMASVLSQTDPAIHPGDADNKPLTAAINKLTESPDETVLATDLASGTCTLVEDDGGYLFQSGVTTDGYQIADQRAADYLNASIGDNLKYDVKKPNTLSRRRSQVARINTFLDGEKKAEHLVEDFYVDGEALDTPVSRGQNLRKILVRGRLISHMNFIILSTEFGTQVVLERSSAT